MVLPAAERNLEMDGPDLGFFASADVGVSGSGDFDGYDDYEEFGSDGGDGADDEAFAQDTHVSHVSHVSQDTNNDTNKDTNNDTTLPAAEFLAAMHEDVVPGAELAQLVRTTSDASAVWTTHLRPQGIPLRSAMALERLRLLEDVVVAQLAANKKPSPSLANTAALLVCEKLRLGRPDPWAAFRAAPAAFAALWSLVLQILAAPLPPHTSDSDAAEAALADRRILVVFLSHCVGSLDVAFVRAECMRIVGIASWHSLVSDSVRAASLSASPDRQALWDRSEKRFASAKPAAKERLAFDRSFISNLIAGFFQVLGSIQPDEDVDGNDGGPSSSSPAPPQAVAYCERFVGLLVDLLAQLPTRRYFNTLLRDHLVVPTCAASSLYARSARALADHKAFSAYSDNWTLESHKPGPLFKILVDRLADYAEFPVDDITGVALSQRGILDRFYSRVNVIQRACFVDFRDIFGELALSSVGNLSIDDIAAMFERADDTSVRALCEKVGIRTTPVAPAWASATEYHRDFLVGILCRTLTCPEPRFRKIGLVPLYPTEITLFDESVCPPNDIFTNTHCPAVPKLTLQYLTMHDYFARNFEVFRHFCHSRLRVFIEDAIMRLGPAYNPSRPSGQTTVFEGTWSHMALPIDQFQISEVGPPMLTESRPSFVKGEVIFSVHKLSLEALASWDRLRPGDQLFLLSIQVDPEMDNIAVRRQPIPDSNTPGSGSLFRKRFGIQAIRGCEVFQLLGDNGFPVDDYVSSQHPRGDTPPRIQRRQRSARILFDSNQYLLDTSLQRRRGTQASVYDTFNVLVRPVGTLANFKSVLESLRDAAHDGLILPDWLQDLYLGYGDRNSAHYSQVASPVRQVHFGNAFADWNHLKESFPDWSLRAVLPVSIDAGEQQLKPPFVLELPSSMFVALQETQETQPNGKRGADATNEGSNVVIVRGRIDDGPGAQTTKFASDSVAKKLDVRFTPEQASAILSGSLHGLTLVAGAPTSGKSTVSAQIIANIVRGFPNERTLVIAPTRARLVRLLSLTIQHGVDERDVVSLCHGFDELRGDSDEALCKLGRVNHMLARRRTRLAQVDRLASSLDLTGAHGSTCENAHYFYTFTVQPKWNAFERLAKASDATVAAISAAFPFRKFFADAGPVFVEMLSQMDVAETPAEALATASALYTRIDRAFAEVKDTRVFEMFRGRKDRMTYILVKQARVFGITAQDASMKRHEFARLGLRFENIVMDDAHDVLEVDAFASLMLMLLPTSSMGGGSSIASAAAGVQRVSIVGDPTQLPPLVRNTALRTYGNLGRSLFARLLEMGVQPVRLSEPWRVRPSISRLYLPLYPELSGDAGGSAAAAVTDNGRVEISDKLAAAWPAVRLANPGFAYDAQMINVGDFLGRGETEPRKGFFQNLGEAEYVVAVYQYMRLLRYPASSIAIVTPYAGQRELIRDVLIQRCSWNPVFGSPGRLSTVDELRGDDGGGGTGGGASVRADIVLLSLVRTKTAGEMGANVRRLAAALAAARLGVYVFCRADVYLPPIRDDGAETAHPLAMLADRSTDLCLRTDEQYGAAGFTRLVTDADDDGHEGDTAQTVRMAGVEHMGQYVHQMVQDQMAWLQQQAAEIGSRSVPRSATRNKYRGNYRGNNRGNNRGGYRGGSHASKK